MRARPGVVLLLTAAAVIVADQVSKAFVRMLLPVQAPVWLIPRVLSLNHVRNSGAAFSILQGQRFVFIGIALLVLCALGWAWFRFRPSNPWVVVALGLVVGGAVGNLIDRAVAGTVTDFIDAQVWPVFNVADSSVLVGEAILIVWLLFFEKNAPSASVSKAPAPDGSPGAPGDGGE
jgi:signal peptidase II